MVASLGSGIRLTPAFSGMATLPSRGMAVPLSISPFKSTPCPSLTSVLGECQALEQRFERVRYRSGLLKKCYPHALRATFATRLAEKGISAPSLTYLLGWESLAPAESYIQSSMRRAHEEMRALTAT